MIRNRVRVQVFIYYEVPYRVQHSDYRKDTFAIGFIGTYTTAPPKSFVTKSKKALSVGKRKIDRFFADPGPRKSNKNMRRRL